MKHITNYREVSDILIDTVKGILHTAKEPKYQNGTHIYPTHISENSPVNREQSRKQIAFQRKWTGLEIHFECSTVIPLNLLHAKTMEESMLPLDM